ncbi:MAG: 2-C-methyl-D-erythritol 2,4-cyclodiphosphate synthase [Bacteroidales bacterium]|nr:MAG: 2-C-methyl-D-erythritol 2,4-cyclodiphosphate synthase [Bacteroidales bacterium]
MKIKVGFGFDVHRFEEGYKFWLGGIEIKHTKGSVGHSDGDTLIHAICDAMLGAANLRDIGNQFPDNDPSLKGIDSKILLRKTLELVRTKGFYIGNIDSTISLQTPKIKEYIPEMQRTLANVLEINEEDIAIKATTTEKLGFTGREEGVAAYAVVLLQKD